MFKAFISLMVLCFVSVSFADSISETNEEKKAKKAKVCSDAVAKFKTKYKEDYSGEKKSLEIIKGDLDDSSIPSSKKVKTAKLIEETDGQILMSIKGKKGKVKIDKKPNGRLSCSVIEPSKPSKKPVDLLKDEIKAIKNKVANIDGSTEKGKRKLADLERVTNSCKDVGDKTYSKIRLEVLALSRARAAKIRNHQAASRSGAGNSIND